MDSLAICGQNKPNEMNSAGPGFPFKYTSITSTHSSPLRGGVSAGVGGHIHVSADVF